MRDPHSFSRPDQVSVHTWIGRVYVDFGTTTLTANATWTFGKHSDRASQVILI